MSWMVSVAVPSPDVDRVSSLLWDVGTNGIAETPTGNGTTLIAGFEQREHADTATHVLADLGWSASFQPYRADWAETNSATISRPGLEFTIEVGQAFGHGSHPTTELCLDLLLEQLLACDDHPMSVLDVGTGTGVLAIAAALAGAQPVVAVEVDPAARAVAAVNIAANDVGVQLTHVLDEATSEPDPTSFDLSVANLLLADLRPLVPQLERTAPRLILSGFLTDQEHEVLALFEQRAPTHRVESEGWVGLVLDQPTGDERRT